MPTQMKTDSKDPAGDARPIGKSVSTKHLDVKYANGSLTNIIEIELCIKGIIDNP